MTDQEIARIQEELEKKYIDQPEEQEELIKHVSETIANDIVNGGGASRFMVNDREYYAKAVQRNQGKDRILCLIIGDVMKFRIAGVHYKPFTVQGTITNDLSWKENVQAIAETWLRHILGCEVAEELDDDIM